MSEPIGRRDFLDISAKLAAMMGLGASAIPRLARATQTLAAGNPPVVWMQGQSCSGCSVSFLNTESPGPAEVLTDYISLLFHSTLSTATGEKSMEIVHHAIDEGGFFLVVEGSMPSKMPRACIVGEEPVTELVTQLARRAQAVIAIGACAAFGGIPAAENNPTGAMSVPDYLNSRRVSTPTIRLPGCPCHPDWFVGTVVHTLAFGLPELDGLARPTMFYGRLIHDQCPRFADYERERFATTFGEDGCLFKLGCIGPRTHADCTWRHWNAGTNTCIKAGAPCVGCASEEFASKTSFPLYTKAEAAALRDG